MLLVLAPGQGSQSPGLLTPWLDVPGGRHDLERWSARTGLDLLALGTTGTAEELRDTAVTQPLLVATGLLSSRVVLEDRVPDAVCGHSVGELTAAAVAGVLTDDDAVALAAERGAAMAEAAALRPTGMAALLGVDDEQVAALCGSHDLAVATVNVPGQVVVAGDAAALDALAAAPPPRVRVRRLDVAGAFHTAAMAPARDRLAAAVSRLTPGAARCAVVANADGARLLDGRQVLDRLVAQLTGPVRFDLCLAAVPEATTVVELAPSGVLTAIAKRALPGAALEPAAALAGAGA